MALTPAQHQASDPAAHAWVEANAGTGKTHVLSTRVLRLLLDGTPPDKILCLTYTRAAAAEMANRVQQRLGQWAVMADDDLTQDLSGLNGGGGGIDAEARARARGLFATVLELPRGLPIQTIHAFCQSLLGRFPVEAGVPPTFTLLDERDSSRYLVRARDQVLAQAQAAPDGILANALNVLAAAMSEDQFAAMLPKLVHQRRHLRALAQRHGGGIAPALKRALGLAPQDSAPHLLHAACADAAFDAAALTRLAEALARGGKSDRADAARLRAWLAANAAERTAQFSAYLRIYFTKDQKPRSRTNFPSKTARAGDPDIDSLLDAETARLDTVLDQCARAALAERSAALLQLGIALVAGFDALKNAEGLVDYDDLIHRAQGLLSQAEMAGWVLYKLDGGIDHILIDEAQDTNPDQWQVVDHLLSEYFAGEGARAAGRTVFAVGDVKQSIYGFQGAQPDLFGHYRQRYQAKAGAAEQAFHAETLDLSFRSTQAVLDLVDAVFAPEAVRHQAARDGAAGLVALWPVEPPPQTPEEDDWALPQAAVEVSRAEVRLADRIADQIALWLRTGEVLPARGRRLRAGDIMILVRRRNSFSEAMVRALKIRQVPVAGIDRLRVNASLAVKDLLALARFALLPEDDYNLAVALKGPMIGLDDDQLFQLAYDRKKQSLWRRLRDMAGDDPAFASAAGLLSQLLDRADYATPFEFFSRLLNEGARRRQMLVRLGAEADDPIDEFLGQCLAYEGLHPPSLEGFVAWIDGAAQEIKRDPEQDSDEVRVMTVHGAKGLQAPVVFLPDTCATPTLKPELYPVDGSQGAPLLWYRKAEDRIGPLADARAAHEDREVAEYRRLLYVALTRAEDRLYIAGWDTKAKRPDDCWYNAVADAMARLTGRDADSASHDDPLVHACPQTAPAKDSQAPTRKVAATPLPDWAERPPPPEPSPPRPLTPSRFDEPVPAALSPVETALPMAAARGRLIHKLLEHLPRLAPDRRGDAVARYLSMPGHGLDAMQAQSLADEVMALLSLPDMARLMDPAGRSEVAVTARLGGYVLSGQIDRLVIGVDEILIADYKSNRAPPARVEAAPIAYIRQMAAYRAAIKALYPDRPIRCFLVWTHGPRLQMLPDRLMDDVLVTTALSAS
ncbi:MAG: double-strand break repair helicase AddA [Sphingomonadales bacterium]